MPEAEGSIARRMRKWLQSHDLLVWLVLVFFAAFIGTQISKYHFKISYLAITLLVLSWVWAFARIKRVTDEWMRVAERWIVEEEEKYRLQSIEVVRELELELRRLKSAGALEELTGLRLSEKLWPRNIETVAVLQEIIFHALEKAARTQRLRLRDMVAEANISIKGLSDLTHDLLKPGVALEKILAMQEQDGPDFSITFDSNLPTTKVCEFISALAEQINSSGGQLYVGSSTVSSSKVG